MSSFNPCSSAVADDRPGFASAVCGLALLPLLVGLAALPESAEAQKVTYFSGSPRFRDLLHEPPLLPATAGLLVVDKDALAFISGKDRISTYFYDKHDGEWQSRYFRPGMVESVYGLALLNTDEGTYLAVAGQQEDGLTGPSSRNCLYLYHSAGQRFFKSTYAKGAVGFGCSDGLYPTLQATGLEFLRYGENKLAMWIGYFGDYDVRNIYGTEAGIACGRGYVASADCSPLKVVGPQRGASAVDCTQSATPVPGAADSLAFGRSYVYCKRGRPYETICHHKAELFDARMDAKMTPESCTDEFYSRDVMQPGSGFVSLPSGAFMNINNRSLREAGPSTILAASSDTHLAFALHDGGLFPEPDDSPKPAAIHVWTADDWAGTAAWAAAKTDDPLAEPLPSVIPAPGDAPLSLSTAGPFVAYSSVSEKAIHVYKWTGTEWQDARIPTEYPVVGVLNHPHEGITQLTTIHCSATKFDYPPRRYSGRGDIFFLSGKAKYGKIPWCETAEACSQGKCVQIYEFKRRGHHGPPACPTYSAACWEKKQDLHP